MIKKPHIYLLLLSFVVMGSCKEKKPHADKESTPVEERIKNISELTYQEIFYLLHEEDEYGLDFHGDMFGQEAASNVSLISKSETDCGNAIVLESSDSNNAIQVVVKTNFDFPGNPANEIFRIYTVKPEESVPVGHSTLCYDGARYAINREIVSAGFL
ncbi:hypothetical protein [Ulvibacterium marinum]|uniref:hypothetical protein n=1 Tax=Ulvibacterium marinum TaxID=2419782 RepID=UPI002494D971|nr:hypothetical protein [Ulvibacterium marinum]